MLLVSRWAFRSDGRRKTAEKGWLEEFGGGA
jgi:hypothetical protein